MSAALHKDNSRFRSRAYWWGCESKCCGFERSNRYAHKCPINDLYSVSAMPSWLEQTCAVADAEMLSLLQAYCKCCWNTTEPLCEYVQYWFTSPIRLVQWNKWCDEVSDHIVSSCYPTLCGLCCLLQVTLVKHLASVGLCENEAWTLIQIHMDFNLCRQKLESQFLCFNSKIFQCKLILILE